jgi:rhamnose transport system permease protein
MSFRERLASYEGFLFAVLVALLVINTLVLRDESGVPMFLTSDNLINMFQLSVEKIIMALVMTFVIINGEIDLSVASIMGLAACAFGWLFQQGIPAPAAIGICLVIGLACGAFNAFCIVRLGIPSLVVTLATMIAFRGIARILVEDRGITDFPEWFDAMGQAGVIGPFPLAIVIFFVGAIFAWVVLERSAFGRKVYFIGSNRAVADYSGIDVGRIKIWIFVASGFVSSVAGILYAARLGAIRGDAALGFELDIRTMVLLGGISIFGGSGTMVGTVLAILIVLALRNGMGLANITGHIQTGVLGVLLILSVMVPMIRDRLSRLFQRGAHGTPT